VTAIAIWLNSENLSHPAWWVAGDSRVTTSGGNVDDSVKLFSLQVICRSADTEGYFSKMAYAHSFGYCFAGSTVMGQNSYLALAPLLSNLIVSPGYCPSLEQVAQYVYKYLQSAYDSFKLVAGRIANFNVAFFGYCHHTRRLRLFHITPTRTPDQGTILAMNEVLEPFLYLGDAREKVIPRLEQAVREQAPSAGRIGMAPAHVIQECINDESMPSIGGTIQFGRADAHGYQHLPIYKPRVLGEPESMICYMGKELDAELSYVGDAKISHMAIPWPWG